ncbi:recombinase family protein [Chamaesiphon sp.]|uniref:recombinase family protein n=1 Tax=Chamaesiphon sp. TaxID=2814140 RepID=UPI003593D85A
MLIGYARVSTDDQNLHLQMDAFSSGRLIFHLFGALAEFERNLMRERTTAGLVAARARGRLGGRPKALDLAKRQLRVRQRFVQNWIVTGLKPMYSNTLEDRFPIGM